MLIVLSLLSMIVGNVIAISQSNIKRMLAYSAIANMGFMLMGFLAAKRQRLQRGDVLYRHLRHDQPWWASAW